jgi:hypothetical protein
MREISLDGEISNAEAASLLGASVQRIGQHLRAGEIGRGSRPGRVSLRAAVRGRCKYLRSLAERASKSAAYDRVMALKERRLQIENARRENQLMKFEDVESLDRRTILPDDHRLG